MDIWRVREQLVEDYRTYTTSFVDPRDERIKQVCPVAVVESGRSFEYIFPIVHSYQPQIDNM